MTPTQPMQDGFPVADLQAFDAAWLANQALPVQSAMGVIPGSGQHNYSTMSLDTALSLAKQGLFIDEPICCGWADAYVVMNMRVLDGVTEYPDMLDTQTKKTSVNPADYPPVAQPPQPPELLVGVALPGQSNCFYPTVLATELNLPSGYQITENGHSYQAFYVTQQQPLSGQTQQILRWLLVS